MDYKLVSIFVAAITASFSHASVVPFPHIVPYQVTYSGPHAPVLLHTQHLDISNEAALSDAGLALPPAPVAEGDLDGINGLTSELPAHISENESPVLEPKVPPAQPEGQSISPVPSSGPEPVPEEPSSSPASAEESAVGLPLVVASANASKSLGGANVNVNVHVNVNGDGKASVYNATSISDIKSPIELNPKLHGI